MCSYDLQSSASLAEHCHGRKHRKKSGIAVEPTSKPPPLDESELFQDIASGRYQNVVVLTGAGVSTAAGVPDFRSRGGVFEKIRELFGDRLPEVYEHPELALTRSFANAYPDFVVEVRESILRLTRESMRDIKPTATHELCAWLHRRGMLKRVYTQNVDGLHLHPSLDLPSDLVVECHGSLQTTPSTLVMYGDDLPKRLYECCDCDFSLQNTVETGKVDLLMVFGTSLQVAPFCGVPNMTPKGSSRVLINRELDVCMTNSFCKRRNAFDMGSISSCSIGSRKSVSLQSLWQSREGNKKWRQLLVEDDCDSFVNRFFASKFTRKGMPNID